MTRAIRRLSDHRDAASFAARARRRRFAFFQQLLQTVPKPVRILDVGGTPEYWQEVGFVGTPGVEITLLNLKPLSILTEGLSAVVGDATHVPFVRERGFDVVFSNSVIEHLGDWEQQRRMAEEVQRAGPRYFVQTPNYHFPIEPHFVFVGFHWLPAAMRIWLVQRFDLGWSRRRPNAAEARRFVQSIRLLRKQELLELFPGADLYEEKVLGMVKSFAVYRGWRHDIADA